MGKIRVSGRSHGCHVVKMAIYLPIYNRSWRTPQCMILWRLGAEYGMRIFLWTYLMTELGASYSRFRCLIGIRVRMVLDW